MRQGCHLAAIVKKHIAKDMNMLTQQRPKISGKSNFVKSALVACVTLGTVVATPVTANAMSGYDTIVTTKHQVKFTRGDIATAEGVNSVYKMMTKKAAKACAHGSNVNDAGEAVTKAACAAELLSQFVKNADIDALSALHESRVSTTKSADLK